MDEFSNLHIKYLHKAKSSWLYPIYIPSWNRAGKAPLLEMLKDAPASVKRKVTIIVRRKQARLYHNYYPWAKLALTDEEGVGAARMAGLRHADKHGHTRMVMMDDDIKHVSLLERIDRGPEKSPHSRRYSSKISGIPEPMLLIRSLAVACKMSEGMFKESPYITYGAARNALFSGGVDTRVGGKVNSGQFPSCVMFIHLKRFPTRELHKDFHFHGEDLAMSLEVLEDGCDWFTLPAVAYDQDGKIESMIPLDPLSEKGRQIDLDRAHKHYPEVAPYLKATYRNEAGGVMRIGFRWPQWYKDTKSEPLESPMDEIF